MEGMVLLQGIVGSTAYGFAGPGSDIDRLGVFAAPTEKFFGLKLPRESYVRTDPDFTWHEAAKWCRLALKCNPTAMELAWLPDDLYETVTPLGRELIGIRKAFLSRRCVRSSYLGYADQQFIKMKNEVIKMDQHEAPGKIIARRQKHARHLVRLLFQAQWLHTDAEVLIRLPDPQWVVDLGVRVSVDPKLGLDLIKAAEMLLDEESPLPEEPDTAAVEDWLRHVRHTVLNAPMDFIDAGDELDLTAG